MSTQHFNATNELETLRSCRTIQRRKPYRRSRLIRFRAELVSLRKAGASYGQLTSWLRTKRIKVARTTVMRYLKKLSKLEESNHA